MEPGLSRFLELVKHELGALDARIELGGEDPDDARLIWSNVPGSSARVVAVVGDTVVDRARLDERLRRLAQSFAITIDRGASQVLGKGVEGVSVRSRLDAELTALASRAGAERAVVFDLSSPMIWGASLVEVGSSQASNTVLERWVDELRSQRAEDLRAAHGHVVRLSVDEDREALARMFFGLYVLALSFTGSVSEPVAVGALLHAADTIERLVLALPPVDPPPGGKVIRLTRP